MHFRPRIILPLIGLSLLAGCTQYVPPPPRAVAVAPDEPEVAKPMPELPDPSKDGPLYTDDVIVHQQPLEEPRFVDAYNKVGQPYILVFVNRDLAGQQIPVNPTGPAISVEHSKESTGAVDVSNGGGGYARSPYDYYSHSYNYNNSFHSSGPVKYTEKTDVYLRPGEYDEAAAKSIDYEMIENIMSNWLSADGHVKIISPIMARQRLTDQEIAELQSGRPQMLGEIAQKLHADILVQITAHPSRQTADGLGIRLIAQVLNTKEEGQQLAQATMDIPPPLEKITLNKFTRHVARILMDQLANSWDAMAAQAPASQPVSK